MRMNKVKMLLTAILGIVLFPITIYGRYNMKKKSQAFEDGMNYERQKNEYDRGIVT